MAVKILMTLDGVDQVTAGFAQAQKAGEDMMRSITGLSAQDPLKGFSLSVGQATQAMGEHARSVGGVTEAYHILHPLLQQVGVSMGELRGLSILARDSLGGLAVVAVAGITIELGKLQEQAAKTRGALDDLFASSAKGQQAESQLSGVAQQLGTTTGALVPIYEAATVAVQRFNAAVTGGPKFVAPGGPGDLPAALGGTKDAIAAVQSFINLLRAGRDDEAQAEAAALKFFTTLQTGGRLTSAMLRELPLGTINELQKAFGKGAEERERFIADIDRMNISVKGAEAVLASYLIQSQKAADAKGISTMGDAWHSLLATLNADLLKISGVDFSHFWADQLKGLEELLNDVTKAIQGAINLWKQFKDAQAQAALIPPGEPTDIGGLPVEGAGAFPTAAKTAVDAAKAASDKAAQGVPPAWITAFNEIKTGFDDVVAKATESMGQMGQVTTNAASASAGAFNAAGFAVGNLGKEFDGAIAEAQKFGRFISGDILPLVTKFGDVTRNTLIFQGFIPTNQFVNAPGGGGGADQKTAQLEAPFKAADEEIKNDWQDVVDTVSDISPIQDAMGELAGDLAAPFIALQAVAQQVWNNIKTIFSQTITVPVTIGIGGQGIGAGIEGGGLAGGGLVSGQGSGTSDSIMAMLSNREFVINARSTEFYGPGFFAALNAMLVPRDLLPGFAMGGLVKAIASTPGQSARTPIVLNIDRHTFNMTATDDVAAALQTLSVSEQMSAAGRSPGWRRS